jgi:hypothetical protein
MCPFSLAKSKLFFFFFSRGEEEEEEEELRDARIAFALRILIKCQFAGDGG